MVKRIKYNGFFFWFFFFFLGGGGVGECGGGGGVMLINRKLDRIFRLEIMFSFLSKNALPMNRVALISLLFMGDGFNFLEHMFMK